MLARLWNPNAGEAQRILQVALSKPIALTRTEEAKLDRAQVGARKRIQLCWRKATGGNFR